MPKIPRATSPTVSTKSLPRPYSNLDVGGPARAVGGIADAITDAAKTLGEYRIQERDRARKARYAQVRTEINDATSKAELEYKSRLGEDAMGKNDGNVQSWNDAVGEILETVADPEVRKEIDQYVAEVAVQFEHGSLSWQQAQTLAHRQADSKAFVSSERTRLSEMNNDDMQEASVQETARLINAQLDALGDGEQVRKGKIKEFTEGVYADALYKKLARADDGDLVAAERAQAYFDRFNQELHPNDRENIRSRLLATTKVAKVKTVTLDWADSLNSGGYFDEDGEWQVIGDGSRWDGELTEPQLKWVHDKMRAEDRTDPLNGAAREAEWAKRVDRKIKEHESWAKVFMANSISRIDEFGSLTGDIAIAGSEGPEPIPPYDYSGYDRLSPTRQLMLDQYERDAKAQAASTVKTPSMPQAQQKMGVLHLKMMDRAEILGKFDTLMADYANNPAALSYLGEVYERFKKGVDPAQDDLTRFKQMLAKRMKNLDQKDLGQMGPQLDRFESIREKLMLDTPERENMSNEQWKQFVEEWAIDVVSQGWFGDKGDPVPITDEENRGRKFKVPTSEWLKHVGMPHATERDRLKRAESLELGFTTFIRSRSGSQEAPSNEEVARTLQRAVEGSDPGAEAVLYLAKEFGFFWWDARVPEGMTPDEFAIDLRNTYIDFAVDSRKEVLVSKDIRKAQREMPRLRIPATLSTDDGPKDSGVFLDNVLIKKGKVPTAEGRAMVWGLLNSVAVMMAADDPGHHLTWSEVTKGGAKPESVEGQYAAALVHLGYDEEVAAYASGLYASGRLEALENETTLAIKAEREERDRRAREDALDEARKSRSGLRSRMQ